MPSPFPTGKVMQWPIWVISRSKIWTTTSSNIWTAKTSWSTISSGDYYLVIPRYSGMELSLYKK